MTKFSSLALAGVAFAGLALSASADSLDRPGSLLVFPCFDNNRGGIYTISVTNTNSDTSPLQTGQLLAGTVDVEFVYINGTNCLEFNRTRRLTPNDTITVTTLFDNPNQAEGYVYVFAKSPTTGKAIKFDWLAGDSFHVAPAIVGGLDIAPIVFQAGAGIPDGGNTDLDNDGVRDLNGGEYDEVSDELLVPRFVAAFDAWSDPAVILIGLTGSSFTTIVNFLVYNDNEEVFSAQYSFDCWDKVRLANINGAFTQQFLEFTNQNPLEWVRFIGGVALPPGAPSIPVGPPQLEYGWYRMDGAVAFSTAASVQDPAFLAVHLERILVPYVTTDELSKILPIAVGGTLPYGLGEQTNGHLVNHGPFPNTP